MLPFYERFIRRFPTVHDLADAELDEVLALWAGMGYYARARNLHKAAQIVRDKYNGLIPSSGEALRTLPGIGDYTAGAIASIAFGLPEPAVDGNVRRVYSRVHADQDTTQAGDWVRNSMLKGDCAPGELTEALMELGALICLPKVPRCADCPLEPKCKAKQNEQIHLFPKRPDKKEKSVEYRDIIIAINENRRYLMRKRTESILHEMMEFPDESTLLRHGFVVEKLEFLSDVEHVFTHRIWIMKGFRARVKAPNPLPEGYGWYTSGEMSSLAIPSAMRAFLSLLGIVQAPK